MDNASVQYEHKLSEAWMTAHFGHRGCGFQALRNIELVSYVEKLQDCFPVFAGRSVPLTTSMQVDPSIRYRPSRMIYPGSRCMSRGCGSSREHLWTLKAKFSVQSLCTSCFISDNATRSLSAPSMFPKPHRFFLKQRVHTEGFLRQVLRPGLDQGTPSSLRHFSCIFSRKMALVTCPCAFRLRRLVQSGCRAPGARHFPVNSRILSRVHVHSGCTGLHKVVVAFLRRGICPILAEHGSYEMSMCISTVWMAV